MQLQATFQGHIRSSRRFRILALRLDCSRKPLAPFVRAMAFLLAWGCSILVLASANVGQLEPFTIRSVNLQKCITLRRSWFLALVDCDDDLATSRQVWYWNQSWLVNRQVKRSGATACANFYPAFYAHHGRPLPGNACEEGRLFMDWAWEDGRIKNPHTGHCFDLPGMNFSDIDGYTSFAQQTVAPVQLGKVDLADDDQLFHLYPVPGLGTPPAFEPLTAETSELQHKLESNDRPGFFPGCPDGSAGERHFCPSPQRGLTA